MLKKNTVLSPSLLACDFLHLEDEVKSTIKAGADYFHADVMDGIYVPNISFGFDIIKKISSVSSIGVDAHLMISDPLKYIETVRDAGACSVSVHNDCSDMHYTYDTLCKIKDCSMKCALALRPRFDASSILPFIDLLDMVLVMTVEPGFGGQKFMSDMLPKIAQIKEISLKNNKDISIQVDGGINLETASDCYKMGADNFVVGTAFYKAPDREEFVRQLKK